MGEGKRRSGRDARLLAAQPHCIFCAGSVPSATVDHVPSIGMFLDRRRPEGLEFGACLACNAGARDLEELAAFVGGFTDRLDTPARDKAVRARSRSIIRRYPALARRIAQAEKPNIFQRLAIREIMPDGYLIPAGDAELQTAIKSFAAKLGLALHYHRTGRIVPEAGYVAVAWYSNYDAATSAYPREIDGYLSAPETLRQGKFTVSDQFNFNSATTPDGEASAHRAVFRNTFATDAFVFEKPHGPILAPPENVFRPGFLRGMQVPALVIPIN